VELFAKHPNAFSPEWGFRNSDPVKTSQFSLFCQEELMNMRSNNTKGSFWGKNANEHAVTECDADITA
jgi:hypothetical protein